MEAAKRQKGSTRLRLRRRRSDHHPVARSKNCPSAHCILHPHQVTLVGNTYELRGHQTNVQPYHIWTDLPLLHVPTMRVFVHIIIEKACLLIER